MTSEEKALLFLKQSASFIRRSFVNPQTGTKEAAYFSLVFLCGKYRDFENPSIDSRSLIEENILKPNRCFAVYSEQLYSIFNHIGLDLLTEEEILLSLSTALIIIVESFGSAAELGAFSAAQTNIEKMWVVNNKKYRGTSSFIENGPIAKVAKEKPTHVIYEEFDDTTGDIVLGTSSINGLAEAKRKNFKKNPISFRPQTMVINDLSFVLCLLFDYVRTFGLLIKGHVTSILKAIYSSEFFDRFELTGVDLEDEQNEEVLEAIPEVLVKLGLFHLSDNGKTRYYHLNFEFFTNHSSNPQSFASMIFESSYRKSQKAIKEFMRVKHMARQEGFSLYGI